jgi:hypothetical protein
MLLTVRGLPRAAVWIWVTWDRPRARRQALAWPVSPDHPLVPACGAAGCATREATHRVHARAQAIGGPTSAKATTPPANNPATFSSTHLRMTLANPSRRLGRPMLPDEPLDTALADAVPLGQLPLRRARGEGRDEPFRVCLRQPIANPPLAQTRGRADAECRFTGLLLGCPKLLHRADQGVCEVLAFGISLDNVHRQGTLDVLLEPHPCQGRARSSNSPPARSPPWAGKLRRHRSPPNRAF